MWTPLVGCWLGVSWGPLAIRWVSHVVNRLSVGPPTDTRLTQLIPHRHVPEDARGYFECAESIFGHALAQKQGFGPVVR